MSGELEELRRDLERQIAAVARQAAHNAMDASAESEVVARRVDKLEARVRALETPK